MNTNVELIFRAICSFHDGEYADFNLHSIRNACGEDALINAVKTLKTLGSNKLTEGLKTICKQ